MHIWSTRFQTLRSLSALPRLSMISSERIFSPQYAFEGKTRSRERHSIFKYTLDGEGVFRDAAGAHRVGRGMGFLTEISDAETAYYYPKDAEVPWTFVYVAFHGGGIEQVMRQLKKRHGGVYSLPERHPFVRRMMECRRDQNAVRSITAGWGAGFVWELITALFGAKERGDHEDSVPVLIRRAQNAVAEHIEANLNATKLAGMLNVSREHLARRFKEETAMTPHQYIVREKMLLACHLLKDTGMSSKEISSRLGYDEPAHFTRTFKRAIQMTPRQFRAEGNLPVA